jgi:DNA-binding response OmpR family regulator
MTQAALLVAEHDLRLVVATALECAGFDCTHFDSGSAALRALRRDAHDLLIVDVDDYQADGAQIVEWRRSWHNPDIVIVGIGRGSEYAIAAALGTGIDDFVSKPVKPAELLARVSAAARRRREPSPRQGLDVPGCSIDPSSRTLEGAKGSAALTNRELAMAQLLLANVGQVVTHSRLARDIWGASLDIVSHSIEQHAYQLRRKLRACAQGAVALRGVYGTGYRLDVIAAPHSTPRLASEIAGVRS